MLQGHYSILRRLGKVLHDRDDDITHEPLPKRWVDLIHGLNEKERRQADGAQQRPPDRKNRTSRRITPRSDGSWQHGSRK